MPEYLTITEVAQLLRTTPTAVYSARHRGTAPACHGVRVGRRILWRRDDIEAWFEARRQEQLAEVVR